MKITEFSEYLSIDKYSLDDAVIQQPSLFYEVAEACAQAIAERDMSQEELALVDARLDREARDKLDTPKEGQIKAYIRVNEDHRIAWASYLGAKTKADKLSALKDAFKQRSMSLRIMADLYASNYFDDSSIKTSATQDQVVYRSTRAKLAKKRGEQNG